VKNTFCPRWLLACSPWKYQERQHWEGQDAGDIHGYDKYSSDDERIRVLVGELERLVPKDGWILDLGCNCGYCLALLKKAGFVHVRGLDISRAAIEYGKRTFGFRDDELLAGSFETLLPPMGAKGEKYFIVYSLGATLELVHPSFDIIRAICDITDRYVLLIISEWDHRYPRFWEYEFGRQGFLLVKCIRPFDGRTPSGDPQKSISLLLFENMNGRPQEGAG
jgi:SAM-dependent methyltransferase